MIAKILLMTKLAVLVFLSFLALSCKKELPVETRLATTGLTTVERQLFVGLTPALSPDGRRIAYTYNGNVYTMDTSGTNQTQLTSSGLDAMPRWSPDGQSVGFIRTAAGVYNLGLLYVVPAPGGAETPLVQNVYVGDDLIQTIRNYGTVGTPIWDWSPDGKYILFSSRGPTTARDVWALPVVGADHQNFRLLRPQQKRRMAGSVATASGGLRLGRDGEFGRFASRNRKQRGEGKPETFTFLGFTLCRHSSLVRAVCVNALVRICAGGDQRWSSLPRQ